VVAKLHLVFQCLLQCKVNKNQGIKVEIVAEWCNGYPLVAIRYDLHGLITSITFSCGTGDYGSQDGIAVVINALALSKGN